MRLDEEVNFNQNNGTWITRQGIVDHNFEYLFYFIVPRRFFNPNYTLQLPSALRWQQQFNKGAAFIRSNGDGWYVPPVYNEQKTNEILADSTLSLDNFTYQYDNYLYKIPNNIYIMYHHTTLKPDLCKYFYLRQLIIHDIVNLIFYYLAEAIRLDINHYPIVYPITNLPDDYIIDYMITHDN